MSLLKLLKFVCTECVSLVRRFAYRKKKHDDLQIRGHTKIAFSIYINIVDGVVVSALVTGLNGSVSSHAQGHCVVFLPT